MLMELMTPVGMATIAAFLFMVGRSLMEDAYNGLGVFVGTALTAFGTAAFTAIMITFAIKYYFYISTIGLDALLKSLGGS